jgi:hypothetical protein
MQNVEIGDCEAALNAAGFDELSKRWIVMARVAAA